MHVTAYFDYGSPYAYLGWQRVRRFTEPYAGHTVEWIPVSAGHIFAADGTKPNVMHPNQKKYLVQDVERWARLYRVPFSVPDNMPANAINAMRLHLKAEAAGLADAWMAKVYEGYFGDGRDISDTAVLLAMADEVGLAASERDLQDPDLKRRLVENTQKAYADGCCGVPYFLVDGDPFWGNDRLEWVEAKLAGKPAPSTPLPVPSP